MKEMKFLLKLKEVPVKITDVNDVEKSFTLRELDGRSKGIFLDDFTSRAVKDSNGKATKELKTVKGFQEGLITLCLVDELGKQVPTEEIEKYPTGVIDSLFEAAQELSGLSKEAAKKAEAEAKND